MIASGHGASVGDWLDGLRRDQMPVLVVLCLALFAADLSVELGVAGGVPYVLPVLASLRSAREGVTLKVAVACSALTLLGMVLSPSGGIPWVVATNRLLALLAIWSTALVGRRMVSVQLALGAGLREKDVLLREVHHRVKNNLQIVSSLLSLQRHAAETPEASQALEDTASRIQSMALVHDALYRSRDLAHVDLVAYLRDMVALLDATMSDERVHAAVEGEPLPVALDAAIPCGLIVNELVTNSLKYAFPSGPGKVVVRVTSAGGHVTLSVRDDGVGLPADVDPERGDTLGLTIVTTLVQQLGGTLRVDRAGGTRIEVNFPCGDARQA